MDRVISHRTIATFVLGLILIAAAVGAGVLSLLRLADDRRWVEHTREVLLALSGTESALYQAEASARGFAIGGMPTHRASFADAAVAARAGAERVAGLTGDNPAQQARVPRLRGLVGERLDTLNDALTAYDAKGFEGYQAFVASGAGPVLMARLHALIAEMTAEEGGLLGVRAAQSARSQTVTLVTLLTSGAANAVLLAVIFRVVRADLLRLAAAGDAVRASEARARALADTLDQRVRRRTAELERANARLTRANDDLNAFAYTVSHDLRAPLRGMQGFATALAEDYAPALDDQGRTYAARIVNASRRMEGLIEDLLGFSRLSREDVTLRPVGLRTAVGDALHALGSQVAERGAAVEVAEPMPGVLAHRGVLAQVVQNLIGNALKFTGPGVRPVVRVWAERRGNGSDGVGGEGEGRPPLVRLWVADNGIGIAPEHHGRIFNVFERLHSNDKYPGTGIGLAIVRKGAERMNGAAGLECDPGGGSRFWVDLPAAPAEVPAGGARAAGDGGGPEREMEREPEPESAAATRREEVTHDAP